MANNKFNKYIGAIALGAAILAVPSCSDDHFDPTYGGDETQSVDATKTLWQHICENDKLTKFRTIAENTKFWKDDKHPIPDYTYADILNSGQVATVWAPEDDDFTDAEFQKWLDMCTTDGYNVQQQFMGNHIALWRNNISDNKVDTVKMINGKNLVFDKSDNNNVTIQGVPVSEKNIPALNGTLHVIKGTTPFHYNFYEYLKFSPSLPILSEYVVSKDTTEFIKDASIEGLPDKDGNPSYVDSVYSTRNLLFENYSYLPKSGAEKWDIPLECFHARLNAEDSAFVMVMPTNEALAKAKEKIAHLYKYPTSYEDRDEIEASEGGTKITNRTIKNPDSLANMSMNMDLTTPLVFNVKQQPKNGSKLWELEDFIKDKGASAKFLLNTFGDTLRTTDTWDKSSIFNGERIEMSNGYGYLATAWSFPRELFNPDIEVDVNAAAFYYMKNSSIHKIGTSSRSIPFNNEKYAAIANKYGKVYGNNFYYIAPHSNATTNPTFEIKLRGNQNTTSDIVTRGKTAEVMSGKYDIQVVLVPYLYSLISDAEEIREDYLNEDFVKSIADEHKMSLTVKVRSNVKGTGDAMSSASATFTYDGLKVDTITVWEDFEFKYSYKNMRFSYPTLQISGKTSTSRTAATSTSKGFIFGLYIDRVILRSKETGLETILDPQ